MAQTQEHPEWATENSLTAPEERDRTNKWRPDQGAAQLTEDEVTAAMKELNNTSFTDKFPKVDRTYADPPPPNQKLGLVSFTPAKGATPNEHGVYGFAKLRGNYDNEIEANQRAEFLIRHVDSYHQIYHTYVGRPFPLTASSNYSHEVDEIDIRKQTTESVSANIKAKKRDEQQTINEIKEREEQLLSESRKAEAGEEEDDPYETYITLKVKKAQLTWTYLEHQKKMAEVKVILVKTRKELEELDELDPSFKDKYFAKYKKARDEAGIVESDNDAQSNFINFMVEEVAIPEVDALYDERYGNSSD